MNLFQKKEGSQMKKTISLLLALVLCLSLCACGNSKNPIIGEWISDQGVTVAFYEDGTCTVGDVEATWSYDETTELCTIHLELSITFSIEKNNGVRFFTVWGMTTYYHADDYHKVAK